MKKIFYFTLAVLILSGCCKSKPEPVHLYGKLSDMGTTSVIMRYNGASSMLGRTRDILIETDADGNFDITFPLDEAAYYSISRNTLFLTPGDDMKILVTTRNTDAEFEGVGAEANIYMKKRLFPKGGSFLEAGRNIKETFEETAALINELAAERRAELVALTSVSDKFRELEEGRITADIVNSYFCYISYSRMTQGMSGEEAEAKIGEFVSSIAPVVSPMIASVSDDKYLDVAVVRDIFSYENNPSYGICFSEAKSSERRSELYAVSEIIDKIRSGINAEQFEEYKTMAGGLGHGDFRAELEAALDKAALLMPGHQAPDLSMTSPDGTVFRLSELKGKVLYVDFWATWCGPCIAESPYFDALAEKYSGKDDILLIKISTDTNREAWIKYLGEHASVLPQYNSTDTALVDDWAIVYIPRFVIIDKDFNIVNAYAERPSDDRIESILDALL